MELYAILSVKYTEIEQDEYERIILLFEKFRFGGKTLRDYELYVLECFKNKFIKLLYKKSKIHKKFNFKIQVFALMGYTKKQISDMIKSVR